MGTEGGLHAGLTHRIIGCLQRVHWALGAGFLERVYENALVIELQEAGLEVVAQAPIEVRYRDQVVGVYRADLLVNALVNVGPKLEMKRRIFTNDRKPSIA